MGLNVASVALVRVLGLHSSRCGGPGRLRSATSSPLAPREGREGLDLTQNVMAPLARFAVDPVQQEESAGGAPSLSVLKGVAGPEGCPWRGKGLGTDRFRLVRVCGGAPSSSGPDRRYEAQEAGPGPQPPAPDPLTVQGICPVSRPGRSISPHDLLNLSPPGDSRG